MNFKTEREGSSSPLLSALVPLASIERPNGLRSGRSIPVRHVILSGSRVYFCTIKFHYYYYKNSSNLIGSFNNKMLLLDTCYWSVESWLSDQSATRK